MLELFIHRKHSKCYEGKVYLSLEVASKEDIWEAWRILLVIPWFSSKLPMQGAQVQSDQVTRPHIPQLRSTTDTRKILQAKTKTQSSQINKYTNT